MLGTKPRPIDEHEARGDTARIYHEIRQTLRVSGVNLNFRTWAGFSHFFPAMWAAMQPLAASQAFESASNAVRAHAVDLVTAFPRIEASAPLGESQRHQLTRALLLYHYINPKLLLFTTIVRRGLMAQRRASSTAPDLDLGPTVPFGPPAQMAAMEMVDENPADAHLRRVFRDIKRTLQLSSVNSDYRTLGLWPDYLGPAWRALKPVVRSEAYREAVAALARDATMRAEQFPAPSSIDVRRLKARGEQTSALLSTTEQFAQLLPSLIINITLWSGEFWRAETLRATPFPLVTQGADAARRME